LVSFRCLSLYYRVFIGRFDSGSRTNWIYRSGFQDLDDFDLYITSFYFTTTTIVTVGYGDIGPVNTSEKFICILLMLIGVISFTFTTGALSSIISSYDSSQAKMKEKTDMLD
jgi:hypothetical protein